MAPSLSLLGYYTWRLPSYAAGRRCRLLALLALLVLRFVPPLLLLVGAFVAATRGAATRLVGLPGFPRLLVGLGRRCGLLLVVVFVLPLLVLPFLLAVDVIIAVRVCAAATFGLRCFVRREISGDT